MTPEAKARQRIDDKLAQAGWAVQDVRRLDVAAARGVAVREYPTDTGPADYVLFVDRKPVGVIEAKRELYLTDKAVKQIAWELGFEDEYYFSRLFKHNADVSPALYRQTVGFARGLA